jgi:hypothetical protein
MNLRSKTLGREAAIGFAQLEAGEVWRVTNKREFLEIARKGLTSNQLQKDQAYKHRHAADKTRPQD